MARAREITVAKVVNETAGVNLELSKEEARFLVDVIAKIGGEPLHSRREYADSISQALSSVGFTWSYGDSDDIRGASVYCVPSSK